MRVLEPPSVERLTAGVAHERANHVLGFGMTGERHDEGLTSVVCATTPHVVMHLVEGLGDLGARDGGDLVRDRRSRCRRGGEVLVLDRVRALDQHLVAKRPVIAAGTAQRRLDAGTQHGKKHHLAELRRLP